MADTESKALQAKEKAEANMPAEQTSPGLVFTPIVDIFETDKEISLMADMPGVKAGDLKIDLHDNVLTLEGEVKSLEGSEEIDIIREYRTGKYYRRFTLSQHIDQTKIDAELRNGVLHLRLSKAEVATPRKIEVKSS